MFPYMRVVGEEDENHSLGKLDNSWGSDMNL